MCVILQLPEHDPSDVQVCAAGASLRRGSPGAAAAQRQRSAGRTSLPPFLTLPLLLLHLLFLPFLPLPPAVSQERVVVVVVLIGLDSKAARLATPIVWWGSS